MPQHEQAPARDRLIGTAEVARRLNIHLITVYRLRDRPGFPAPRRIANKLAWRESDIDAWIASQPAARGRRHEAA